MQRALQSYALTTIAGAALLTGCGASQALIGAPGATSQASVIAAHGERGKPWMLPEAKNDDLLYVADAGEYLDVLVYSYPAGTPVGALSVPATWAACADQSGHVFFSSSPEGSYQSQIFEYAHGGTSPINVLQDGDDGYFATDCSVDPRTGNLAVANESGGFGSYSGNVAIYADAQGSPRFINARGVPFVYSCVYDDRGNLYVDGEGSQYRTKFARLDHGDEGFKGFELKPALNDEATALTWHGGRLDVADDLTVYEFKTKARSGREVGEVSISGAGVSGITIRRGVLVGSGYINAAVYLWHYPSGGNPYETITKGLSQPEGVAISAAPSRPH